MRPFEAREGADVHIMAASTARTAAALFRAVVAGGKIGINVLVVTERESLKGGKIRGLSKAGLTFAIISIDYHRFGRAEIRFREATLVLGEASELTENRTRDASDVVRGRA